MNIKISADEAKTLFSREYKRFNIGSYLYGTSSDESDLDQLVIYNPTSDESIVQDILQINHQFQYDDEVNNTDFIFTTMNQFYRNLYSGESTINADVVMFNPSWQSYKTNVLDVVRSYNIIKAYIGFAKRDIKLLLKSKKNKIFHISRGLYTAECLLNNKLPELKAIQYYHKHPMSITIAKSLEVTLRHKCNSQYERDELQLYGNLNQLKVNEPLVNKLIESKNIKEFKYE